MFSNQTDADEFYGNIVGGCIVGTCVVTICVCFCPLLSLPLIACLGTLVIVLGGLTVGFLGAFENFPPDLNWEYLLYSTAFQIIADCVYILCFLLCPFLLFPLVCCIGSCIICIVPIWILLIWDTLEDQANELGKKLGFIEKDKEVENENDDDDNRDSW